MTPRLARDLRCVIRIDVVEASPEQAQAWSAIWSTLLAPADAHAPERAGREASHDKVPLEELTDLG